MSVSKITALGHDLAYHRRDAVTPDGISIAIQDWGLDDGRRGILFIHGFSQAHPCWLRQLTSPLREEYRLITYDMRGHGGSGKPSERIYYAEPLRWANELRCVMEAANLDRPILVAWSYAGRIALDYISHHGDSALGGLVMVSATSANDPALQGPAASLLAGMGDTDENVANQRTSQFIEQCTYLPVSDRERQYMLDYNMLTPPFVRRALRGRPAHYDDTLHALNIPLLVIHGDQDRVILPAMADHTTAMAGHGSKILYRNVGHMPFWEDPVRFNADLDTFLRQVKSCSPM